MNEQKRYFRLFFPTESDEKFHDTSTALQESTGPFKLDDRAMVRRSTQTSTGIAQNAMMAL